MIEYILGDTGQYLILTDGVLRHFWRYRQSNHFSKEAGGQLFAHISGSMIIVERATGPHWLDKRNPFSFVPNRIVERHEIKKLFREGLHFIGDWHTHPEAHPRPSVSDEISISDIFNKSHHQLAGFLLVIVGGIKDVSGLFVGISNGKQLIQLSPRQSV